ncbi:MAG: BrnT family toxin [Acidobacteria bacterium]|nr:BrnT family toxin [Acidobacteriota bacterium]MBI3655639.1 BrnT family toxin [Acidobacteriota bacterium]
MLDPFNQVLECIGFQWDAGKVEKNWIRHQVSRAECEELFFNKPLIVAPDVRHPTSEPRLYGFGQTDEGRLLFAVFTVRNKLIRVIPARDMNKREGKEHERAQVKENDKQDTEV